MPASAPEPETNAPVTDEPLRFPADVHAAMTAHMIEGYPLEACGLLVGRGSSVARFVPCTNTTRSARIYAIDPGEHLRAELAAERDGWEIVGVVHSHTHTEAYPSPTDVAQAPDPTWHYVIVTLRREVPEARSFRIVDGEIVEEPIVVG